MLTFEKRIIKSSRIEKPSIIPDIHSVDKDPFFITEDSVTPQDNLSVGKGMIKTILPYKMQNRYSHDLYDVEYNVAVLENEYLKAVFLIDLGGRLWSLYDKKKNVEVVYENDAVRLGNLALRNAWFAGGVEWNIGIKGHSPLTCEPLFAQKVITESGEEALKMYAYEEIRGAVYSILAILRQDELIVNINIENPNDKEIYMYWWSNIAFEQNEYSRVFTPTNKSFITSYRDGGYIISKKSVPLVDGKDISYPKNAHGAIDYFYDIPKQNKKWIACLGKNNTGLLQFSDKTLIGRKLFLWGNITGGKHFNEWLTGGRDYLEIQAGLLKTQFEHFLMPAHSEISWCEVYKAISVPCTDGDYFETVNKIDELVYDATDLLKLFRHKESESIAVYGNSYGALEEMLRGKRLSKNCIFPKDSITKEYKYYIDILNKEYSGDYEIAYVSNPKWGDLISSKPEKNALDYYFLGVNYYICERYEDALQSFSKSISISPTYYAYIALALMLANVNKDYVNAVSYAKKAIELSPSDVSLARTFGEICIKASEYKVFVDYINSANGEINSDGRIKMYYANCLIHLDELEKAKKYINKDLLIPDIKEGEYSISNIWIELYRKDIAKKENRLSSEISDTEVLSRFPLPYEIDFRMH